MTRAHNKSDLRCQLPHERILERNVAEEEEEEKKDIKTERMQFSLFSFSFFFSFPAIRFTAIRTI